MRWPGNLRVSEVISAPARKSCVQRRKLSCCRDGPSVSAYPTAPIVAGVVRRPGQRRRIFPSHLHEHTLGVFTDMGSLITGGLGERFCEGGGSFRCFVSRVLHACEDHIEACLVAAGIFLNSLFLLCRGFGAGVESSHVRRPL